MDNATYNFICAAIERLELAIDKHSTLDHTDKRQIARIIHVLQEIINE